MSDRNSALLELGLRSTRAMLPENQGAMKPILDQAVARVDSVGAEQMLQQIETAMASGEPGLLSQQAPNYIMEEALVRTFASSFGQLVLEGDTDQIPEMTYLEAAAVRVISVAVTAAHGGPRTEFLYDVVETPTRGMWREIQTEPVSIPFVNAFFKRRRAVLETQANDKMAYAMTKHLDNLAWTAMQATLKIAFAASDKVFTFKDADVIGLPTGNDATSALGFWPSLRENVLPFFQGVRKADRVINIHIRHTELKNLWKVAAIGTQGLGGWTDFQREVFDGNIQEVVIYGHRVRIIPENWKVEANTMYCSVGPVFKMWLPPSGSVSQSETRGDGSSVRSLHRIYEILSPSPWWTNIYRTTYNPADTTP